MVETKSKITGVVGLDLSLTCTGLARIEARPTGNFVNMAIKTAAADWEHQAERLMHIAQEILQHTSPYDIFFIEDYAFGAKKGENSLANLGELGGVVKMLLWRRSGWPSLPVNIAMWKKFLCNKHQLNKDEFKMQVFKKFNVECQTNDEAAALALADFGFCVLKNGHPERDLTKYETDTIEKYRKQHMPTLVSIAKKAKKEK